MIKNTSTMIGQNTPFNFSKMFSTPKDIEFKIFTFNKDETIMSQTKDINMLYVIIDGKVKVSRILENGNRSIVHFAKPGDFIGELELLGVEDEPREVKAQTEVKCLGISVIKYQSYLLKDVVFLNYLSTYLALKLLDRTNRLGDGSNYQLIHRLSAFILEAQVNNVYKEKHTEVAEYLNVSYRHLTHTFKRLMDEKIIIKKQRSYVIINLERLSDYAGYVHV
ncbi:MAG: transcriptional regulator YeiL [Erysipelothrix sp.]